MYSLRFIHPSSKRTQFESPDNRQEYLEKYLETLSPNLKTRVGEVLKGKVRDFLTDPKIVDQIQREWDGHQGNSEVFDPSYFCLTHLTNYFPVNGEIIPTGEKSLNPRFTTHFCLNGCVTSHELGNWEDSMLALVLPIQGLGKSADTFLPQDVIYVGRVKLPKGSFVVARNGLEIPQNVGVPVETYDIKDGDTLRRIVHERLFDKGYLPARIGAWSWLSEPYRTITSDGRKVCHELGTYIGGGFYPDEVVRLESIAKFLGAKGSDFHDARNWTKLLEEDMFEKFKPVYDFVKDSSKVKMTLEEFESKFPRGMFGNFEFLEEREYLVEQIENYRQRMKQILTE